jgi:hypothetical protein
MAVVSLAPPIILQFFDNLGRPAAGGSVLTQVGGLNYPTYQDSAGSIALPNPIPLNSRGEISNAAGISSQLFLVHGQIYTFTLFDANGNQLNSAVYVPANATAGDIANLQAQIAAFATSITTGSLTVTGSTTLGALSVGAITGTGALNLGSNTLTCGAITATGETLSGPLAMGGNPITGVTNLTATGTITAAAFSSGAPNAASFLTSGITSSGSVVNFNTSGTSSGSGITNSAGTITLANIGTYDVTFSGSFQQPSGSLNIDTNIYFGGTANTIVGPVSGNGQRLLIAGANGAVYALETMRALVITSATNQTLNVSSALAFSGNYEALAGCYIIVAQR